MQADSRIAAEDLFRAVSEAEPGRLGRGARRGPQAAGPGNCRADQADDRLGDLELVTAAGLAGKELDPHGRVRRREPRLAEARGVVIGEDASQVLAQLDRRARVAVGAGMGDLLFAAGYFEVRRDRVHEPL